MSDRTPRFHLSLRVRPQQLDDLVIFYGALFGVRPSKRHDDYVQFDLVDPPLNLTFTPTSQAQAGEIDHLGIQVFSESSLQAARLRLTSAGLALREEPLVECCYARQNKFWLTDPEGREVEVFHKMADIDGHGRSESAAPIATAACCAPSCCSTT